MKQMKYNLALLLVPLFWGAAFPIFKTVISYEYATVAFITGMRFLIASLLLLIIFYKRVRKNFSIELLKPVAIVSLVLFGDYFFGCIGVKYTTATNSGFYMAISVIFVPFIMYFFDRNRKLLHWKSLLPVFITVLGIYFLSSNEGAISINKGDILCLIGSMLFALYIVLSSKKYQGLDFACVTVLQMAFVGTISMIVAFITEGTLSFAAYSFNAWTIIGVLGVFCTAVPFCLQNIAQAHSAPVFSAIVYSAMSLFSALISMILLDERLFLRGLLGGTLIIVGIVLAKLIPMIHKKTEKKAVLQKAVDQEELLQTEIN